MRGDEALTLLAALCAGVYGTDVYRYQVIGRAVGVAVSWRVALEASVACFFFGWTTPGTAFGAPAAAVDKWAARGFIRFGLVCVLALGGGFGGWAAMAQISGAVIAGGQMRVQSNKQVVQHPDGGVVGEIMAHDGDVVEAGAVLPDIVQAGAEEADRVADHEVALQLVGEVP